jgi:hypothetical protein
LLTTSAPAPLTTIVPQVDPVLSIAIPFLTL